MLSKIHETEGKKSDQTAIIEECARDIEDKSGRREMKVTSDRDNIMSSHMTMNKINLSKLSTILVPYR